jgi:hypothetical protein
MRSFAPLFRPWVVASGLALWTLSAIAAESPLSGTKTLRAQLGDGSQLVLGTVDFAPAPNGTTQFKLSIDHKKLTDHFLSMREFKCLQGTNELTCYVPYPYANPRTIQGQDYSWLEHSLLFFYKAPRDFGAKLWNGMYFEFKQNGASLVGTPKAVDLDQISAPPEDLSRAPFAVDVRHDIPADARWVRSLVIE